MYGTWYISLFLISTVCGGGGGREEPYGGNGEGVGRWGRGGGTEAKSNKFNDGGRFTSLGRWREEEEKLPVRNYISCKLSCANFMVI